MSKAKEILLASDALRLMLIIAIAGLLLGIVYTVTHKPIQVAQNATTIVAYKKVPSDAADLKESPDNDKLIAADAAFLVGQGFDNVMTGKVVDAVDMSGDVVGHTINAGSRDGYGGLVSISVGTQSDNKAVDGIAFLTIVGSTDPGMSACDTDWYRQSSGKKGERFTVTKADDGELDSDKINTISDVTITSCVVTNSVNATLYFVNSGLNQ